MRQVIIGHRGMVGSALHRLMPDAASLHAKIDFRNCGPWTREYLEYNARNADVLYLCAARVGGIQRNISEPGSMLYDNLMIQANVIEAARLAGVKLIVFLGSSCIYPREGLTPNAPWTESDIGKGALEPTNEPYAIAKIAGLKMLEAYHRQYGMEYLAVMPCNLYGPGDNFDPETSHFIPAMIRKFHEAKQSDADGVTLWGTGRPRRELMHVDDCARIILELVQSGARGAVNIGPGVDNPVQWYAHLARSTVGCSWLPIDWDTSRPDGVARKLLDVSKMRTFGCEPKIGLVEGLAATYTWFLENKA